MAELNGSLDIGGGFGLGSDAARVGSAILFIQASTNAMDVFSALNSSPWTSESFGADPDKAASCRRYVYHSLGVTAFYSFSAAALAKSFWPILGWGIAAAYMYMLYERALEKAQASGSTSWGDSGAATGQPQPAPQQPAPQEIERALVESGVNGVLWSAGG